MSDESTEKFNRESEKRADEFEEDTTSDTESGQERPEEADMDSTLTEQIPRPQRRVHRFKQA